MKNYNLKFKIIFFCLVFLSGFLVWGNAMAADLCVSPTGAGLKNGSDWNNAINWSALGTTGLVRGNTYYLSDGTYSSKRISTPVSGTDMIIIKKATVSSHASDTGWTNDMGDGQAVFSAESNTLVVNVGYITIDGVTGSGEDYNTYGFKSVPLDCAESSNYSGAVSWSGATANVNNFAIKHFAAMGCPDAGYPHSNNKCSTAFVMHPSTNATYLGSDLEASYLYQQDHVNSITFFNARNGNIHDNYFANTWGSPTYVMAVTFSGGTNEPVYGTSYYGETSGETIVLESVDLISGDWDGSATGIMYYHTADANAPHITNGEHIHSGAAGSGNLIGITTSSETDIQHVTFNTGTTEPVDGLTYYGETSGAVIILTHVRSTLAGAFTGTWDGTAEGYMYYLPVSGHLVSGENIRTASSGAGNLIAVTTSAESSQNGENYCHSQHVSGICTQDFSLWNNIMKDPRWAFMAMHGALTCTEGLDVGNYDWNIFNNILVGNGTENIENPIWVNGIIENTHPLDHNVVSRFNIHHNTHYNIAAQEGYGAANTGPVENAADKSYLYNNLFYNCTKVSMVPTCEASDAAAGYCDANRIEHDYNAYLTTTGYTAENNAQINATDPFVDSDNGDYRLKIGTPPINNGKTDLGATYANDFLGNPRGTSPDIGAYEYVETTDVIAPAGPTGLSVQ